ncbi:MAG: helix-turn-helix domain-containing protein [Bacteroidales bacterium]|nr:helix-turn-helix domain-containing protein [Bacteroidales bacterium]
MKSVSNPDLQLALDFVQHTNRNIFLTGKAGTGKTTFLHNLKTLSPKRMIVVAPTGVAAINAGGVTIHSFFQLPFHPHIPVQYIDASHPHQPDSIASGSFKISREKINIMKSLDLLVIDEISMVRADLLDAVDAVLRRYKNKGLPFGGVQLLMIGDLQQLPPVIKDDDREILFRYYETGFFFGSHALRSTDYVTIELKHIYRQRDQEFISLLNKIRDNQLDASALAELNKRYNPQFDADADGGYITLTTHNAQAQSINEKRLANLSGKMRTFKAIIRDDFPEYAYPTSPELELKKGAQVMFVKNDISKEKLFFNGKIGKITGFDEDVIVVQCAGDDYPILVEMAEWQNMKYSLNEDTKEIEETVIGTFIQYPLKLAWAITIHKSQGLTFDRAIIDAQAAFAHGQVYVALSRCRSLDGLILSTPVAQRGIISDPVVSGFIRETEKRQPDQRQLADSKNAYQENLIMELFDFSPVARGLQYCLKLLNEHHQSIVGSPREKFAQMLTVVTRDLTGVAEKFHPQLKNLLQLDPDAETNETLQERINKASHFFTGVMENNLADIIKGLAVETDNKETKKSLTEAFNRLRQDIFLKMACLESVKTGFRTRDYLETKAKAVIEPPAARTRAAHTVEDETGVINHPELFRILKAWRDSKAKESNLPHYMILHQRTLETLCNFLPQNPAALKQVKGMGKAKFEKYGNELLEIITDFCLEEHIDPPPIKPGTKKVKTAVQKPNTRLTTFDMFRKGKTPAEIAHERGFAVSTIEGHLAHYIGTGEVSVNEFVSPDIVERVAAHLSTTTERNLAPIKAALGNEISYSDIRFVMKHLDFLQYKKNDQ